MDNKKTWYKENTDIDFNKPILAIGSGEDGNIYLLIPQIEKPKKDHMNNFKIIGYNWLNIKTGQYNSCAFFETVEDAMRTYDYCEFKNAEITEVKHG